MRMKSSALTALSLLLVASASAQHSPAPAETPLFPATIPLPNGFQPEGVTAFGTSVLVGSLLDGDIYQASVISGSGRRLVDAPAGRTAIGLKADRRGRLFVAGGPLGTAYVYDVHSGAPLADYQLAPANTSFINDLVVAGDSVYFTDSFNPVLYRLPLAAGGRFPDADAAVAIPLSGPAAEDHLAGQFNLNGIVYAAWARALVVVNYTRGILYQIDPDTGASARIDLGSASAEFGDGLVLRGLTLYVVQNNLNAIAKIELDAHLTSGRVVDVITDPNFQIPTTADAIGPYLFAVNARFDVAPPPVLGTPPSDPNLTFDVIRVRR